MIDDSLNSRLSSFISTSTAPVLFAGAGVSARAGLPTWGAYLERLAEVAKPYDHLTYLIMMQRIEESDYLQAASYYFLCNKIPQSDKYKALSTPLSHYNAASASVLARLPFTAIVTTNYDRVMQDAYAHVHRQSPMEAFLGDPSLAAASFNESFYVARIHGRAEVPEELVLTEESYSKVIKNSQYINFLVHLFTRTQLLFVGFSFLDPAIAHALQAAEGGGSKVHSGSHLALLPSDATSDLIQSLERFSISKVFYDPANEHHELWSGLQDVAHALPDKPATRAPQRLPMQAARRYLASCYTRAQLGTKTEPLRMTIVEGIIAHLLRAAHPNGHSDEELEAVIESELTLPKQDAKTLVGESLISLSSDRLIRLGQEDKYYWSGSLEQPYDRAVNRLVDGAIDRLIVRENGIDTHENRLCLRAFFTELFLARGWDLGAAFAARRTPDLFEIEPLMNSIQEFKSLDNENNIGPLLRASEDLLSHPNSEQATLLADLGRLSFGLELVHQAPHDTLFHALTLPETIYLDTNVLMPAFTVGHPYYSIYRDSIDNLLRASQQALKSVRVVAYHGYLNEVVSHRRLAIEEMEGLEHGDLGLLRKRARLFGTQNLNVFVGAFANLLATEKSLTFERFLSKYAPYSTEGELAKWLRQNGVEVLKDQEMLAGADEMPKILLDLEKSYAGDGLWKSKDAVLVRHDAVQLAALQRDMGGNVPSLFVSADKRLREKVGSGKFSYLANMMITHLGLAQLIDLLVGNPSESRGLASLLWDTQVSSETEIVRNYLIDLALEEYDDALVLEMHDIVGRIAEEASEDLVEKGLRASYATTGADRAAVMKNLEVFEERYFSIMREIIEKRRSD